MNRFQTGWKNILWAVDALAEDMQLQKKAADVLGKLNIDLDVPIEPVYVLGPDELKVSADFFSGRIGEFRFDAEKKLNTWMGKIKLKGLVKPTVLVSNSLHLRNAVKLLLDYARQSQSDLIVASTLARCIGPVGKCYP